MKNQSGYTLIELLAVVIILVIVSTIIAFLLTSTLRTSNKSQTISNTTQNGNYALSVITDIILSSTNVTAIGGSSICDTSPSPLGTSIQLTRMDGGTTVLSCQANSQNVTTIASNGASLLDTAAVQIQPNTCYFRCTQPLGDNYSAPLIEVEFNLENAGTSSFTEQKSSINFKTSVTMRNYNP